MKPLHKAIEQIGGPSNLASLLGVSVQAVCFWRDGQRRLPAEKCPDIERATGGVVTCEELRPDLVPQWQYLRSSRPDQPHDTHQEAA